MYLQPVGDKSLNEQLARSIEPDEENVDALIDVTITQGAAPVFGYGLLLEHHGTCNGITTFDTQAMRFDRETQKLMARELLHHIYHELTENIRYAITQSRDQGIEPGVQEEATNTDMPESMRLSELLAAHPDLTEAGAHHIDTTHLASIMRIARLVDDPEDLQTANEVAIYGRRLHEDFQYPGSPPFEDTYVDHQYFFGALLGNDVDTAIAHFENKIQTLNADQVGPVAEETFVDLLVRLGRNDQALSVVTERLLGQHESLGIAPPPFEIANTPERLNRLRAFYESEGDLLGFAVSVLTSGKKGSH
jgi:hypothetical protein